jgi:nicotinamide mononucleotide transporter
MTALCAWLAAHGTSCLELFAATLGIASVLLSIPENIWSWPTGIVNVVLYFFLFIKQGYYANAGLQIVYLGLSLYGWYQWLYGGRGRSTLHVSRASATTWTGAVVVGVLTWVVLFTITRRIPGGAFTYTDAATVAASLIAEWMVAKKLLENWVIWIVVDTVYVGMFVAGGNYLTAVNYAVYLALGVMGLVAWKRSLADVPQPA